MNGRVKGEYGDSAFPAFTLNAKVNDAAFQYPDLPLPARSIFMDLALTNPGGSADSTVVKLDRFHLLLGGNPVDVGLVLKTPVSDPNVDFRVKGKVDLADVRRAVKLQGMDQLTGTVAADAAVKHPDVGHRQEAVRQRCRQRQRGCRQPHPQGQDAAASARDPAGVAPARAGAGRAHRRSVARSAAAISRRPARSTT